MPEGSCRIAHVVGGPSAQSRIRAKPFTAIENIANPLIRITFRCLTHVPQALGL